MDNISVHILRTTLDIVKIWGNFPGCPVVKAVLPVQGITGSIPGQGTKIPHALWCGPPNFFFLLQLSNIVSKIQEKKENVS